MIYVGEGRELGFGGRAEMEETELEEGEAYDYHDDDARIDPDVDLSYLDEKVQHVLGHLQKDFEGGELSAENLGAKYGGYGSFLPTQQRSPSILSHPRSSPKIQRFGTPRSPNNLPSKDSYQKPTVASSAILSTRLGPASTSAVLSPVSRGLFVENPQKTDVHQSSFRGSGDSFPKHQPVNKYVNSTDQKTLKVRIKMGPDNMAQKTAALYSGLGLDVSPSSSPEDSPNESGGLSPESRDSPDESPTSILQIMTSFPVPGGLLLSPLGDRLLHLMEKKKLLSDGRSAVARKGIQESSTMVLDESTPAKGNFLGETKRDSVDRSGTPREVKHGIVKDVDNEISALLKKEIDIETPEGKELVSNSLKLPLLSSSKYTIGDAAYSIVSSSDISGDGNKAVFKEKWLSSDHREDVIQPIANQDADRAERPNSYTGSADKGSGDRKISVGNDAPYLPKKDGKSKGSKSLDSSKVDADGAKWKNGVHSDPRKDKVSIKVTSQEQDGAKMPNKKDHFLPGGKKKSKGSQSNGIPSAEVQNESSKVAPSASSKDRKVTSHHSSKNTLDENKYRESGKTTESHRGLLGDAKMEQTENSLETPFKEKPKEAKTRAVEKESSQFAEKSKERSSGKKVHNQLMSEACPKAAEIVPPPTGNGLVSDAVPAAVAPVVIEENWVCCDKCQKWRLLPFGTNPAHLPKKWLCSMLNWLPGKNSCSISEEETTKALNALYQLPVQENQNNLHCQGDQFSTRVTSRGMQPIDQMPPENNLGAVLSGGKKKQGLKEITNAAGNVVPAHLSSSIRKTQSQSTKSRSLNDVNQSPLEFNLTNKSVLEHSSKSSDSAVQKRKHKQKEKQKSAYDEGDAKHKNMDRKRGHGQDGFKSSKKIKSEGMNHPNEDWNFDHGGTMGKVAPSSSNGFSARESAKKDVQKYNEYLAPKDTKYDINDCLPRSAQKVKEPVQVSLEGAAQDTRKSEKMNVAVKKRKVDEWQDSQIYEQEALPNNGRHLEANEVLLEEETSGSELKKEKKARVSKSDGKASSTSKGNERIGKRSQANLILTSGVVDEMGDDKGTAKDHQLGHNQEGSIESQPMLEGINTVKKDVGCIHPSLAATSSSSKVSGSHKKKANAEEVKGSPVESVSSSPLRIPNADKVISAKRVLSVKDDMANGGYSVTESPRRYLDGEGDYGSDRAGMMSKEKTSDVVRCGSLDYQDRGANKVSVSRAKAYKKPSHYEYENLHVADTGADTFSQHKQHLEMLGKEHAHDDVRVKSKNNSNNGSLLQKSGKGSSSRSKDKHRSSKSEIDKGKIKVTNSFGELEEPYPAKKWNDVVIESHDNSNYLDEMRDAKYNFQKKYGSKPGKDAKNYLDKKDSAVSRSSEGKRENQSKLGGHDGSDIRLGANCDKNDKSYRSQTLLQDQEGKKSSHQSISDGTDPMETTSGRGKSQLLPDSGDKLDTKIHQVRPISGANKGSGTGVSLVDASGSGGEVLKGTKQPRKSDNQDGAHQFTLRQSTPNGHAAGDLDGPVAVRRDSSNQAAANALKEAKDLKHSADRLKNSGSDLDRTGLYFEAALKFLYGASLLEPCNVESAKHGETQSVQVYSSTANLCEFVAHEYERCKEMAAAALAYKCMEVAYLRVIYSKHVFANRDRHELQATLQMLPPGESPSSSASDVDNLNNQGMLDKSGLGKGISSPHVAGSHVIVARNRPNFARLLNFAQDVNLAMEASRKSQNAFAAANVNLEEAQYEIISSVKRVLDFNFHDVQGLLRLVRLAIQAISR